MAGAAAAAGVFVLPASASAPAQSLGIEQINRYDSNVTIESNGSLLVRETIRYDFGVVPHHGIFRDIPNRFDYPKKANTDRVTPITVVSVRASAGTPADYETSDEKQGSTGYLRLKIGDPDKTITGEHTYEITYRVKGALNGFPDHDELVWNAVGTEWSVPVQAATADVTAPADIPRIGCAEGPSGSNLPCETATASGTTARLRAARPRAPRGPHLHGLDPEGRGPGSETDPRGAFLAVEGVHAQRLDRRRRRGPRPRPDRWLPAPAAPVRA